MTQADPERELGLLLQWSNAFVFLAGGGGRCNRPSFVGSACAVPRAPRAKVTQVAAAMAIKARFSSAITAINQPLDDAGSRGFGTDTGGVSKRKQ
jgi:hypothetical protein